MQRYKITKRWCWPNATFTYNIVIMELTPDQLKFFAGPEYIMEVYNA